MAVESTYSSPLGPAACEGDAKKLQLIPELTTNADQVQEKVLAEIRSMNAQTEYPLRFKLAGATDHDSYKSRLPAITYEDQKLEIQRIANGDQSAILSAHPISEFPTRYARNQHHPCTQLMIQAGVPHKVSVHPTCIPKESAMQERYSPTAIWDVLFRIQIFACGAALFIKSQWGSDLSSLQIGIFVFVAFFKYLSFLSGLVGIILLWKAVKHAAAGEAPDIRLAEPVAWLSVTALVLSFGSSQLLPSHVYQ